MEALKKTSKFLIMAITTALLAACGNNGSSSNSSAIVPPLDCQNCANISSPILMATAYGTSVHASWPADIADFRIFGDANLLLNSTSQNYNVYTGPISAQGVLRIRAQIGDQNWSWGSNAGCAVTPGDYPITTYRVGSISMGTNMDIPEMIAGPMRIRITQAMLYREGSTVRIRGQLHILSVNGQMCGPFYTSMN